MNFMFSWQEQYNCHQNIKFIFSRHRVISSTYNACETANCSVGILWVSKIKIREVVEEILACQHWWIFYTCFHISDYWRGLRKHLNCFSRRYAYFLFFIVDIVFIFIDRCPCTCRCLIIEYCGRNRRDRDFCQRWIVRILVLNLKISFRALTYVKTNGLFFWFSSPVPELSFLPTPYRGWTRAGERRVQDNLHAHAQNAAIFSPQIGGKTIFGSTFQIQLVARFSE